MADPTYDTKAINANPLWELAFSLSEIQNDLAPIGWSRYISIAQCLLSIYDIKLKGKDNG
jgi:hypothetical protein